MLSSTPTGRFLKDVKLLKKRKFDIKKLEEIIGLLCEGKELPNRCRAHILSGEWNDCWECHIAPDWLLIYRFTGNEIHFLRTGTHSDLF